jgi:UTP-glucose-1-phosphate uridylyltransferase
MRIDQFDQRTRGEAMGKPVLVVLAAGIGSRYGGLKQIDPVGPHGELIVDYSVFDALRAGFGRVVFVISRSMERLFRERVGRAIERQCETTYVFQALEDAPAGFLVPPGRQKPWGTAHATLVCKNAVHTSFAVINADDFYGRSSFQNLQRYLQSAQDRDGVYDYCMVGFALHKTLTEHGHVARGVCTVDPDGFLLEIRERTRIQKFGEAAKYTEDGRNWIVIARGTTASMNMWGFTPSLFRELEDRLPRFLEANSDKLESAEFFLPNVIGDLIREKKARVKVLPTDDRWFGITYQQDKLDVKQALRDLIRDGVYPANLWADGVDGD